MLDASHGNARDGRSRERGKHLEEKADGRNWSVAGLGLGMASDGFRDGKRWV